MSETSVVIILLLGICFQNVESKPANKQLPSYIDVCDPRTANENSCYIDNFNKVLKKLKTPLPELGLRAFDPLEIEKLHLEFGGGSFAFDANLTNIKLFHITEGGAKDFNVSWNTLKFGGSFYFPRFDIVGDYKATGRFLLLNIDTNGVMVINCTGAAIRGYWNSEIYTKRGKKHIRYTDAKVEADLKTMKINLSNLIPNNPEITENTNQAINANIDVLYKDLIPIIHEVALSFVADALNRVYSFYPVEVLWPGVEKLIGKN